MAKYNYPKYKILIDPDSKKVQGLKVGDVVRREYYDAPNLVYSLMVVQETGVEMVGGKDSAYFIGALIEGNEPATGQPLDFVRITSLLNEDRGGAIYLTASDSDSPYMDIIDGLSETQALSYPTGKYSDPASPNGDEYGIIDPRYIVSSYLSESDGRRRVFRMRHAGWMFPQNTPVGLKVGTRRPVSNPQRIMVSFMVRGSHEFTDVPINFGYADGTLKDFEDTFNCTTQWEHKFYVFHADYPAQYERCLFIELNKALRTTLYWMEVAELNVILVSDIAQFSKASKGRFGKITGVVDPIFGVLDGYGAYFQNLYATRNVNVAGTLTAGDENGFSSTFYVGKIHKNVILNSLSPEFLKGYDAAVVDEPTPTSVGNCYRIERNCYIAVQDIEWARQHEGEQYCFSVWVKAAQDTKVLLGEYATVYLEHTLKAEEGWKRLSCRFDVTANSSSYHLYLYTTTPGLLFTSPQLEAGNKPSLYQPTDGTLSYVEDYGAWFSKGGIGGTIQNPLLRLNGDGSISSRDGSFVINPDGTGHMASGRFRWTGTEIILQDFTIKWEDLSTEAQDHLKAKSVALSGTSVFHYPDELLTTCEPATIHVFASETNFTATTRKWYYQGADTLWHEIPNGVKDYLEVLPGGHYWEGRNVLPIKYVAGAGEETYEDVFTITKQYDGSDSYAVYIDSANGNTFRNGIISTTLSARVLKGGEDVTDLIPDANFRWLRTSNDSESDEAWNAATPRNKTIEITGDDVFCKAVFDCEVTISIT